MRLEDSRLQMSVGKYGSPRKFENSELSAFFHAALILGAITRY